ncbi:sodium/hydrogen exchanger [Natronococcus amylolyticus DSM 10524]|uniref:Sodium/hydrogen exchanger n=1 Tax=Natronococcus amylolyticus DSM 10524 TaxID=1227497 RepID=L9X1B4_9EURY|nr:cation:proton antiporter [Natronococcus amylolyticus]ELY54383.1 sodium/hydrogen exchanger [Natronococcus amylolyticus DSM 10524]
MAELVIALSVVFVTAGILLLFANHFGLSPIPFYIIAGLIVGFAGEMGVVTIEQTDLVELAQWGIAFLVFVFGIRVEFDALRSVIRDGEGAAITLLVVVAPIAFGIGYLFGEWFGFADPVRNAIYFSAAATLSSTIVGAGLLETEIRDNLVHGRLANSIHFFDDLVAIGLILILSAEAFTADVVTSQIGYGVLFLIAALLIYRHGFPLLIRLADGVEELILMGSISILIGFIAAAEYVGISIVVGAFAAGIAVRSEGAESLGVRNGISSIRDFFVAIFFVTVGALVQFPTVEMATIALALVGLVLVVNPIVLMLAFTYEGYDARTGYLASSSLNQVSELSLVIAIQALLLGTIAPTLFDAIILAAAVTMILTSAARRYEDAVYERVVNRFVGRRQTRKIDERSYVRDGLEDHIVLVGYGRQGRWLVETFERIDAEYVVIENDPVIWDDLRAECRNYVLGDAMARYPWQKANVDAASLVVSTVEHRPVSEAILEQADCDTILRAETSREGRELLDEGATFVNVPNVLAADQLVETVETVVADERSRETLREQHRDTLATLERYGFATQFGDG